MTARALLVRGLVAGLLAGFATFFVAYQVGEPHVEAAIALEETGTGSHDHPTDDSGHSHGDDAEVSRSTQRTWGLLTGSLAIGVALGGLVGLFSAGTIGRVGLLSPTQSTALVALAGGVSVSLVPFLKYPATPPAVGSGETIDERTGWYFALVVLSVVAAASAWALALLVWRRRGGYAAAVAGAAAYLAVVVVLGNLLPTVNEVGDFPADTLWFFRRASLLTLLTLWVVLGVVLCGFVQRLQRQDATRTARRALAASL